LIHVVDSSGSADAEGNTIVAAGSEEKNNIGSNPMDDLDWIFNELIQWVFFNVTAKWDVVVRKGRDKVGRLCRLHQHYNILSSSLNIFAEK